MTGRDFIIHILKHNLENEQLFSNGKFIGFMTVTEAAEKFKVGEHTVKTWCAMNRIQYLSIGKTIFIPEDAKVIR